MTDGDGAWNRALLATALLAVDPGLGGLVVRARAGPVRDRLLERLAFVPLRQTRLSTAPEDAVLFGGTDTAATLATGTLVRTKGLSAEAPRLLILPMAERMPSTLAARLACVLESGHVAVALDEAAAPDEGVPASLADRLALHVALDDVPIRAAVMPGAAPRIALARARLPAICGHEAASVLVALAAELGVPGLRAPWLALRTARACAALAGRAVPAEADVAAAACLVLAPRATTAPDSPEPPEPPEQTASREDAANPGADRSAEDRLLQAARTALPPDLLRRLASQTGARPAGTGAGACKKTGRRGRPLASQPGRPSSGERIDVHATLCAAAPWQTLRRQRSPDAAAPVLIRPADLRVRRFETRSESLLIFAVDASGSAAQARLAEAKGAVELLLGEAYARRDFVAMVAFRGRGAETVLPPTRSLTRARRCLSGQPAGGATPLAHGLRATLALAEGARARGMSPAIALLTDGRANIALDTTPDRKSASEDAMSVARALRALRIPTVVLDVGGQRDRRLLDLAATLGAECIALPRANAGRISDAIRTELKAVP